MKMTVFWDVAPCSLVEVSEVLAASIIRARVSEEFLSRSLLIALMMEAASISETL
jgi:hypothetical protein